MTEPRSRDSAGRVLHWETGGAEHEAPQWIVRFNAQQRLQHALLAGSIVLLFLTGFPIKYAFEPWASVVTRMLGGFHIMFSIHLVAATLMILSGVYHLFWIAFNHRNLDWAMLPGIRDLRDAGDHFAYLLGWRKAPPDFGRYTYLEKFEYFAVFYGIAVMGLSGFFLSFPELGAAIAPRWVLDILRVVHSNEAFLCFIAIAVGHSFWVHFHPSVFPSSTVWYKGTISEHHLAEEHPADYRRWLQSQGIDPSRAPHPRHELTRYERSRLFIAVELAVYGAIAVWMYATFVPMVFQ